MARRWLSGPVSALGLGVAAIVALLDQASKVWALHVYDLGARGSVTLTPFFDLVLVWNQGISYGLLPQEGALGRLGGAIGNAIDRVVYGAVADFFSFHAFGLEWYVFNIADTAIVAGVVGLLYDSLFGGHKKVGNHSKM